MIPTPGSHCKHWPDCDCLYYCIGRKNIRKNPKAFTCETCNCIWWETPDKNNQAKCHRGHICETLVVPTLRSDLGAGVRFKGRIIPL